MFKAIKEELINQHNQSHKSDLDYDFEYLEKKLQQSQIDIHKIKEKVSIKLSLFNFSKKKEDCKD